MFPFSIDKNEGLDIVRNIIVHLSKEGDVSINETMNIESFYSDHQGGVINFKHKLCIIELELGLDTRSYEEPIIIELSPGDEVEDDYADLTLASLSKEMYEAVNNEHYNRSNNIEIHHGSYIENDAIHLTAYLHNTSAECDVSYPTFTYDNQYQCFIIKDDFWGAPNGIDCNGLVTILDFSNYQK